MSYKLLPLGAWCPHTNLCLWVSDSHYYVHLFAVNLSEDEHWIASYLDHYSTELCSFSISSSTIHHPDTFTIFYNTTAVIHTLVGFTERDAGVLSSLLVSWRLWMRLLVFCYCRWYIIFFPWNVGALALSPVCPKRKSSALYTILLINITNHICSWSSGHWLVDLMLYIFIQGYEPTAQSRSRTQAHVIHRYRRESLHHRGSSTRLYWMQ